MPDATCEVENRKSQICVEASKILIVDDNEQVRYMLQVLLKGYGYQVTVAPNGAEALEIARRIPPDLIISDILMPVMDGFTLCREWKKDERLREIPFVFYTATYTDPRDEELALNLGAARFIVKPVEPDAFVGMLREVIAEAEAGRLVAPREPIEEEPVYLKEYSERLIKKLEDKMLQLEEANRALEREIAERKRAEEALRESEERFRRLADQSPDIIFRSGPGGLEYISPACIPISGFTPEEYYADPNLSPSHVHPDEQPKLADLDQRLNSGPARCELRIIHKDGRVVWTEQNLLPIFDDSGKRVAVEGVVRDITERKQAEETLRESEESYRELADSITDVFFAMDQNLRYTYWNKASESLTGIRAEDALGKSLLEVFSDTPWLRRAEEVYRDVLRTQQPQTFVNDTDLGGRHYVFEIIAYPSRSGISVFVKDITERKRAEEALKMQARVLENMVEGVNVSDENGIIFFTNPTFDAMFGYERGELIGKHVAVLNNLTVEESAQFVREVTEQLRTKGAWFGEVSNRKKDGTSFTTYARVSALEIADKKYWVSVQEDITERKRAEETTAHGQRLLLALSQAAQAVQRAHTPDEVYHTVMDEVAELGYHATVFNLTDDRAHLALSGMTFKPALVRAAEKLTGLSAQGYRFPLVPGGLYQRVTAEKKTIFEETAGHIGEALPGPVRPLASRLAAVLGFEQAIYAPLTISGETTGLLTVSGVGLTEADVPAVTAFANQAAIAIENARLFEQVQAGRERLRWLTQQVVSAQEEERHHLSRELHDAVGQTLTTLKISLDLIQADLPVEAAPLRPRLGQAMVLTDTTLDQIRLLARDLRPPALDAAGLNPTLEGLCLDFAQRTGLSVEYVGAEPPLLPEGADICLYRFLQEALTNVAKHAHASRVWVVLGGDAETVSLSVEDDGQGFEVQARMSKGIGLLGMRERLGLLGGQLEIESQPGQGARLTAYVPLEKPHLERRRGR